MSTLLNVEATTPKGHRLGTDRVISPQETLDRVLPHAAAMGITRIANITHLDAIGVPVAIAVRPNSRSLSVTQGKGLTLEAAKASALMEAIESYHADHIIRPLMLGSANDLAAEIRLTDLDELVTENGAPYSPHRPQLWVEGEDLLGSKTTWLPYDCVHCDFTYDGRLGRGMYAITSNGLASGNHILEATSHALCEVVERDASALWQMQSPGFRRRSRVDIKTVDDPSCQAVLDQLAAAGIAVGVWEITSPVGLPAFFSCIVPESASSWEAPYASEGAGCHPRREIALLRALTEAVQSRLTIIVGSRDDVFRDDYERLRGSRNTSSARALLASHCPMRRFHDAPTYDLPSFDADIELELALLKEAGFTSVVRVDLTKPQFGVPVVRVVIPGAEFYVSNVDFHPGPRARYVRDSQ